jgi:hypothetical protein
MSRTAIRCPFRIAGGNHGGPPCGAPARRDGGELGQDGADVDAAEVRPEMIEVRPAMNVSPVSVRAEPAARGAAGDHLPPGFPGDAAGRLP